MILPGIKNSSVRSPLRPMPRLIPWHRAKLAMSHPQRPTRSVSSWTTNHCPEGAVPWNARCIVLRLSLVPSSIAYLQPQCI